LISKTADKFWKGFESRPLKGHDRRYVIVFYWSGKEDSAKKSMDKVSIRHPSVKVKVVTGGNKMKAHSVTQQPTVLLLKNGREVDRVSGDIVASDTILSQLFRKATS
jgi:hypothetical protein